MGSFFQRRLYLIFIEFIFFLFSSCNKNKSNLIIGDWKQIYKKPSTVNLKGYKTLAFHNDNTGRMQLYDGSLKLRFTLNFTYSIIENGNELKLKHLPYEGNYFIKDSVVENWIIKNIDDNTLTVSGDYMDLNYQKIKQ